VVGGVCKGRGEEIDRKRSRVVRLRTKMIFTVIRYEKVTWNISDDVCEVGHEAQTASDRSSKVRSMSSHRINQAPGQNVLAGQ
jgi:hypothetical protein